MLIIINIVITIAVLHQSFTWGHPWQPRAFPAIARSPPIALDSPSLRQHFYNHMKCLDTETGRELFIGDFYTRSGQCVRVQCLGSLEIWEDRCQIPRLSGDNCTSLPVANEFLDYPRCCPTYECRSLLNRQNSQIESVQTYDHTGGLIKEHITQRILLIVDHKQSVPS